jgi:hypothetical protein
MDGMSRLAQSSGKNGGAKSVKVTASQRGIRLQRRRVNSDRFPAQQAVLGQNLQQPHEHQSVRFYVYQPPRPGDGRMVWALSRPERFAGMPGYPANLP